MCGFHRYWFQFLIFYNDGPAWNSSYTSSGMRFCFKSEFVHIIGKLLAREAKVQTNFSSAECVVMREQRSSPMESEIGKCARLGWSIILLLVHSCLISLHQCNIYLLYIGDWIFVLLFFVYRTLKGIFRLSYYLYKVCNSASYSIMASLSECTHLVHINI